MSHAASEQYSKLPAPKWTVRGGMGSHTFHEWSKGTPQDLGTLWRQGMKAPWSATSNVAAGGARAPQYGVYNTMLTGDPFQVAARPAPSGSSGKRRLRRGRGMVFTMS